MRCIKALTDQFVAHGVGAFLAEGFVARFAADAVGVANGLYLPAGRLVEQAPQRDGQRRQPALVIPGEARAPEGKTVECRRPLFGAEQRRPRQRHIRYRRHLAWRKLQARV